MRLYLGADDNSDAGEHDSSNFVNNGPSDGGSTVLNLDLVGVSDNFFILGGDSMHMLQVVSQARKAGLELTVQQLYQYQTIAELAALVNTVDSHQEAEPASSSTSAAPALAAESLASLIDEIESLSEEEVLARVIARVQEVEQR